MAKPDKNAPFMDEDFLLQNEPARTLYHEYAKDLPIIDYHNHLPPDEIAKDINFRDLTQIWLGGDHYKWRAMRAQGIDEQYITGRAEPLEKFKKWAETVPFTMRNPLFHWTHLELQRYFGIEEQLTPENAEEIFKFTQKELQKPEFSVRGLLKRMNVEVVCTTDDPVDSLKWHKKLQGEEDAPAVLPAFRPDKAVMAWKDDFGEYLNKLEKASGTSIKDFKTLVSVLEGRIAFFHEMGCRLADHGLEELYADSWEGVDLDDVLGKARKGKKVKPAKGRAFAAALLYELGKRYHEMGWTQQFHIGAQRDNNTRMFKKLGPDTGFDSMGDFSHGRSVAAYLDRLDSEKALARTIFYNLNPRDNALFASLVGAFNDGKEPGKIQWGAPWWFLDQKDGIEEHLNTLSNIGLVSRFVGMLTDSRSFLSFPRHEYFRRILCNVFGTDIDRGLVPDDLPWAGKMVRDICYYNAKNYFRFPES